MVNLKYLFVLILLMIVLAGCNSNNTEQQKEVGNIKEITITISAAASLTDALNEIKTSFENENSGINVTYNIGSSGTLQQQIMQGAPVDIFFSAAEDKFHELEKKGFIKNKDRVDLVGNEIVLVTPIDSNKNIKSFSDLNEHAETISIGTPEMVPAGKYAIEMFRNMGILKDVESRFVFAKDVRQVLNYVETGNVDAGVVYKTDALISSKINVIATAKEGTHTPIIYPLGIINKSKHPDEAKEFYNYMQSEKALTILEKYGFTNLLK